ncbi:hypothetical protein EDC96DRAFT_579855 [Choanephora cucurbitarum]|nr:hypothetical protein EDC96DRAFT_579855 [Choanephora cucurbitarum]
MEKGSTIFVDRVKNTIQYKTFCIVPQYIENALSLTVLLLAFIVGPNVLVYQELM